MGRYEWIILMTILNIFMDDNTHAYYYEYIYIHIYIYIWMVFPTWMANLMKYDELDHWSFMMGEISSTNKTRGRCCNVSQKWVFVVTQHTGFFLNEVTKPFPINQNGCFFCGRKNSPGCGWDIPSCGTVGWSFCGWDFLFGTKMGNFRMWLKLTQPRRYVETCRN